MTDERRQAQRVRAGVVSLLAGTAILALKTYAYFLTGSMALASDALEGAVNVIAAVFGLGAVIFAGQPADRNHPYGHGKMEFFAAAFEGGLISLAAALILYEAALALAQGVALKRLGLGMLLNVSAGALNGLLGWYLLRAGRRLASMTLEANGLHILSDFWSTAGVFLGLTVVRFTGILWLDSVIAIGIGILLTRTGCKLVRESAAALLDEEDSRMIATLVKRVDALQAGGVAQTGVITVHGLRAIRAGRYTHVDIHLVVPEYAEVAKAHDDAERFEGRLIEAAGIEGECHTHIDPCRRKYCAHCGDAACPIRVEPFRGIAPVSRAEATRAEPPD